MKASNKIGLVVLIAYWVVSTTINAGAVHASKMAEFEHIRNNMRYCREDLGFAWSWGAMPFTTPIGFFVTGFWYDGFRWDCNGAR